MSNAKRCDRCGNLYETYEKLLVSNNRNTLALFHTNRDFHRTDIKYFDMCPGCMTKLISFLEGAEV